MSCRSSHMIKLKLSSQLIGQFGHVTASASCKQPEKHGTWVLGGGGGGSTAIEQKAVSHKPQYFLFVGMKGQITNLECVGQHSH